MNYFDGIKVGDRVWTCTVGWTKCVDVLSSRFVCRDVHYIGELSLDMDGKNTYGIQIAFWDEVKIIPPPRPKKNSIIFTDEYIERLRKCYEEMIVYGQGTILLDKKCFDIKPVKEYEGMSEENKLQKQKEALVSYLLSKVEANDWHAVSDAANDIRVIEAKLEYANSLAIANDALFQPRELHPDGVK